MTLVPPSNNKKSRGEVEIIGAFLDAVKDASLIKSDVMRTANIMNNNQFEQYKDQLLENGFIELVDGNRYLATEKGLQALHQIRATLSTLKGEVLT